MKKNWAIILFLTCMATSGCSLNQQNWSMWEVSWLWFFVLVLTGYLLYTANRVTLQFAGAPLAGIGPGLCLLGLFFLVLGSKLAIINSFGSDVPYWDQWGLEGFLYPQAMQGTLDPSVLFKSYGEHNVLLSRLFVVTLFNLNGQWDPIVEMVVNSIIYSLILTGLCLVLWRIAGRKNLPLFCVMISISGVLHFGWENTVSGFQSCFYFLLGFSLFAIVLLVHSKPFTIPWFLGLAAALLGQFSLGSGCLAPLAVACVLLINYISGAQKLKESAPAAGALVAVAVLLFLLVPAQHPPLSIGAGGFIAVLVKIIGFLKIFARVAAWPFRKWGFAPLVWFPFFMLIRNQFRTKRTSQFEQLLLALGIWALLHVAAIIWARVSIGFEFAPRYKDELFVGVLANLIIAFYLLRARVQLFSLFPSDRWVTGAGGAILVVCTATSLLHLGTSDIWTQYYRGVEETNIARYVLTGDPSTILNQPQFHIPFPRIYEHTLISILDNPVIRKVLPACIREPLPLEAAENSGFIPGGTPPGLPVLTHRRVLGSWSAGKVSSEYLSQPVSTSFPYLVFDVAGGGRGISFEILPSDGRARTIKVAGQTGEWKKVVVKMPKGPFRLHVTDQSEEGYIAFSQPRELSAGGYYIRKILSGNLLVIAFGMIGLLAGVIRMFQDDLSLDDSDNPLFPCC